MKDLIDDDVECVVDTVNYFEVGNMCPLCKTGMLEEIPSGILACDSCNYSD